MHGQAWFLYLVDFLVINLFYRMRSFRLRDHLATFNLCSIQADRRRGDTRRRSCDWLSIRETDCHIRGHRIKASLLDSRDLFELVNTLEFTYPVTIGNDILGGFRSDAGQ